MDKAKKRELELAIRAHARYMFEWGQLQEKEEEERVKKAWKFVKKLLNGV